MPSLLLRLTHFIDLTTSTSVGELGASLSIVPYTVLLLRPLRVRISNIFFGEKELKENVASGFRSWNLELDYLGMNDRLITCDPGLLIAVDLTFPRRDNSKTLQRAVMKVE